MHTDYRFFEDRYPTLTQSDLITFHVEFLSRAVTGNATISIQPLKIGRQFSTVRVSVIQPNNAGNKYINCMEALVTQGNIARELDNNGLNLITDGLLDIPKKEDCDRLELDPAWTSCRPVLFKLQMYLPPGSDSLGASPTHGPSFREQWVKWAPGIGAGFSIPSLAFLADCFRPLPEAYGVKDSSFPTLNYGMEIKKAPPSTEWEWLFLRVSMGVCVAGRHDYSIVIADEQGEIVAVSRHTALIFNMEAKNAKARTGKM
jgi:hypothetical protein